MTDPNSYPSGDERSGSTLVSEEELMRRAAAEGIDVEKICVIEPRWAESKPREEGVLSALVHCDLIVRSDGSIVCLDGAMGGDSIELADRHMAGESNPENLAWEQWVHSVTELPVPYQ